MAMKVDLKMVIRTFWDRLSLRKKLSLTFVMMTLLPIILTTFITWQPYEQAMKNAVVERNTRLAEEIAFDIDGMFAEKIKILKFAANTEEMKSMNPDRQGTVLRGIVAQYPDMQLAVVSNAAGQQIARWDGQAVDQSITYLDRDYYHRVMTTGTTAISGVIIAKSTQRLGIVIAEPITDYDQTVRGVLIINIELQKLINHVGEIKIGNTGYAYIVNSKGEIIIHPDRGLIENGTDESHLTPIMAAINGETGWVEYESDNQRRLAGYSYVPSTKWGVIAQQPLNEAMYNVIRLKNHSIVLMVGAASIAMLIGLAIAGALAKPIADISAATNRLAEGDLTIKLAVRSSDEMGQLADNFNNMTIQLVKRDEALRENEEKYRSLVENVNIGVYRITNSFEQGFMQVNPAMAKIFGYDQVAEFRKKSLLSLFHNSVEIKKVLADATGNGFVKNREISLSKRDGNLIWCSLTITPQYDEQGSIKWLDGVIEDITERKQAADNLHRAHNELENQVARRTQELMTANEELQRISFLDSLTGIANRRYFDEILKKECQRSKRNNTPLTLIMIDVDYFKVYNDTYGHVIGDNCLKRVAEILNVSTKRDTDLVARYGGEEFAVILPNTDVRGAGIVGETMRANVEKLGIKHQNSPRDGNVTISVGIAVVEGAWDIMPMDIIAEADQALYQAKRRGRNRIEMAADRVFPSTKK